MSLLALFIVRLSILILILRLNSILNTVKIRFSIGNKLAYFLLHVNLNCNQTYLETRKK